MAEHVCENVTFFTPVHLQGENMTKYVDENRIGHTKQPGTPGRGCVYRATIGATRFPSGSGVMQG